MPSFPSATPPFVPELKDPTDSSNFEEVGDAEEGADPLVETAPAKKGRGFQGNELPFIGFTFQRRFTYGAVTTLPSSSSLFLILTIFSAVIKGSGAPASSPAAASSGSSASSAAIAAASEASKKLQGELDQLQVKLARTEKDLESAKANYEQQGKRVATLESTNKTLLSDLNEMTEQLTKTQQQAS